MTLVGLTLMVSAAFGRTATLLTEYTWPGENTVSAVSGWLDGLPSSTSLTSYSWSRGNCTTQPRVPRIGCIEAGQDNEIAGVEAQGILVASPIGGVTIRGNSIHDNGSLGIDLIPNSGGSGITPNDIGDADAGGNELQNFPILSAAESTGANTRITGSFNSTANQTFTLDFYESPLCDASGIGEGARWIGSQPISTAANGNATIDSSLAAQSTVGAVITATATNSAGSTSEFSNCVTIAQGNSTTGDVDGDGDVDISDLALLLGTFGLCSSDVGFNAAADFDQSRCVELGDLAVLLANFGG